MSPQEDNRENNRNKCKQCKRVKRSKASPNGKKKANKEFNNACKNNEDKISTLNNYKKTQQALRNIIQQENTNKINATFNTILAEGGVKSHSFWKM